MSGGLAVFLPKGYDGYKRKRPMPPAIAYLGVAVLIGCVVALFACQLPARYVGEVAACNAAYDACFDAAAALDGTQPEKAAAFTACRSQVDARCLDLLTPPPPAASASAMASAAPSSAPSAAPSASASPAASAAPSATPSAAPAASAKP